MSVDGRRGDGTKKDDSKTGIGLFKYTPFSYISLNLVKSLDSTNIWSVQKSEIV
jgi:hypothetical protein